jgi:hypothetical protein
VAARRADAGHDGDDHSRHRDLPVKQRELAAATDAQVFEVALDHLQLIDRAEVYNPALLQALAALPGGRDAVAA